MALVHEKRLTLEKMNELLCDLDRELEERGYDKVVPIRTLGGYAMLFRGLRPDNPTTPDIDTSTPAFDAHVLAARDAVAKRHGLTPHWLNNDTVLAEDGGDADWDDVSVGDALIDAAYDDADLGLAHLDVRVATVDTLMHAKALAACDVWSDRGDKDMDDCLSILDHENVRSYAQATRRFPFLKDQELSYFETMYAIAKDTAGLMRATALQAHRDMIKASGLEIPDIGAEVDDFAYGYEDEDMMVPGVLDDLDLTYDWY